jgi:hypothetical protein
MSVACPDARLHGVTDGGNDSFCQLDMRENTEMATNCVSQEAYSKLLIASHSQAFVASAGGHLP